jgi:signal peptidase complex subunit 1
MVDFKGQLLAERVFQFITITATLVGFVYGWAVQSFEKTFECWAVGVVLAAIACVPDWWFYRKNPIKWREPDYSVRCGRCVVFVISAQRTNPRPVSSGRVVWLTLRL